MIKAVFLDYTGTMIQEGGGKMQELVRRICENSSVHDPQEAVKLWWRLLKKYEEDCSGENYRDEDEIVGCILRDLEERISLQENLEELHRLVQDFWVCAPAFPETAEFFEKCPVPIYIISNNGAEYVKKGLKDKGLTCAGIISGDMARAYKPRKEIFERALEVSGCKADQVIHVGDSYSSDVLGARSVGIRPVLLERSASEPRGDVETATDLTEVLELLRQEQ